MSSFCCRPGLVPGRARGDAGRAAETMAMVADDRFDRGKQLCGRHQSHGHPGAAEHRLDDFTVAEVGDDDAVLDGITSDDPAGRNPETEDGISRGRKLMHEFSRGHAAVVGSRVALLENHDAASLDPRIAAVDGRGREIRESHVGDEAPPLLDLQHGLPAIGPVRNPDAAAQQAGFHAHVRQRLGEAEGPAPDLPVLPGFGGMQRLMYAARCSGVPRSWMGESARLPARLQVAAPPSTQASSIATSARARFFGPSMKPPWPGSMKQVVIPASSNAFSN